MRRALGVLLLSAAALPGVWSAETPGAAKEQPAVEVGKAAPDFTLPGVRIDPESGVATEDAAHPFHLAERLGQRPVVLIFSSFT
jgi:hypothetical protein